MSQLEQIRGKDFPIQLLVRMSPPWVFIDEIRRFTESFCACACPGQDREAQVALAVHELMQNAVPHSHEREVDLVLEVDPAANRVQVGVTNECEEAEYAALRDRIQKMNDEKDALRHYVVAMKESPTTIRGGLGLARVRFEAQLDLSVSRTAGRVTVLASGALKAPPIQIPGGAHV
jgi:anti-sigma regulatory factor (Ser/Thr protein kinase)